MNGDLEVATSYNIISTYRSLAAPGPAEDR